MHDPIGHNHRVALNADTDALRATLAVEHIRLSLARAASLRAQAELERHCWQNDPHAPADRAHTAKEALRAAHARRMRLRNEIAARDADLFDQDDYAA